MLAQSVLWASVWCEGEWYFPEGETMQGSSVLISGLGIAGPTLAYWLLRHGFRPTLVERASSPRAEGYIVDFWGAGYDIIEKMGLLPEVLEAGYRVREVRIVDSDGRRTGGFDAGIFRAATGERFTSLSRGELSAILYRAIEGRAEVLFGNSVTALEPDLEGVLVHFESAAPRRFDLVVGADGLHSIVRTLAFGSESRFEHFVGYSVAAFEARGYSPRDEGVYVAYAAPGRQVARFSLRDDRTLFLLVAADGTPGVRYSEQAVQKQYVCARLSGLGWECPQILSALQRADALYFDRVSQIRMPRWSSGRVALVGDAACAPSLLAGEGAALAILGAYVLAGELAHAPSAEEAFARYEQLLGGFMARKQRAARAFAGSFAPKTRAGIVLRNLITKLFAIPYVAHAVVGSSLRDDIRLPDYDCGRSDGPGPQEITQRGEYGGPH